MLVGAAGNMFKPILVVKIPVDGLLQSFFKSYRRFPSQFFIDFGSINSIPAVMTRPVFYIGDQLFTCTRRIAKFFIHLLAKQFDKVDIPPFIKTTDIISIVIFSFMKNKIYSSSMIFYKQPVTGV